MVDTNILVSALLFPGGRMGDLIHKIAVEYTLVLSSYIVDEFLDVIRRKFAEKAEAADALLGRIPYELVYTPKKMKPGLFEIRDENDYPALYSAITEDVDIFITGDKDFGNILLERPEILTPALFFEKY
jgi:putative PIN family toxin of toxin-antitoxin system